MGNFCGNTIDNPKNESCHAIEMRGMVVSTKAEHESKMKKWLEELVYEEVVEKEKKKNEEVKSEKKEEEAKREKKW